MPQHAATSTATKADDIRAYTDSWDHQATVDWLATQPGLLGGHEGEWVAFAGRQIIAHGPDLDEVMQRAREVGVHDPLLVPVPPAGYLVG
jgi:hypothetical protein